MKVLSIMVDVTELTENEIEELQYAMEVQCEDAGGTSGDDAFDVLIISSTVREVDENGEIQGNH